MKNKRMAVDLRFQEQEQEAEAENVLRGKVFAALFLTALLIGMLAMFMPDDAKASAEVMHVAPDSLVDELDLDGGIL